MSALKASNLTRRFFRKRGTANYFNAVDDVSLTLESGKITVLHGPSGSGKSTLLNMMAGILKPTSGTLKINGTELYGLNDLELSAFRNKHIGVIPQGQTAIHSLNVLDNVLLPYELCGRNRKKNKSSSFEMPSKDDAVKRAESLLDKTGIPELKDVMPSEISGGELRRMAVSRAMIMKPDIILADEPTADLDDENTKIVLSLMRFAADEGCAVFIVTHEKDVFSWADEVLTMKDGRISYG